MVLELVLLEVILILIAQVLILDEFGHLVQVDCELLVLVSIFPLYFLLLKQLSEGWHDGREQSQRILLLLFSLALVQVSA